MKKLHEAKPPYIIVKPKQGFADASTTYHWGNNKTTKVIKVSEELHGRLLQSSERMQVAYKRRVDMKKLSQKVQSVYDQLMENKRMEEVEERESWEKHEHFCLVYTMICKLLQLKHCPQAYKNLEKLQLELEQDDKFSWGTPFNGIFFIDRRPTLNVFESTSNLLLSEKGSETLMLNAVEEMSILNPYSPKI